ncbi:MAG: GYF domain-containing protein [Planctomycetota bacterium]
MSTEWFYMSSSWLRKPRRVGPISESQLLSLVEKGQIEPETLIQSAKTRDKWIPMNKVGPAMARYRKTHPETAG